MYIKANLNNNNNKKRVTAIIMSALLVAGLMMGCGAKADAGGTSGVKADANTAEAATTIETDVAGTGADDADVGNEDADDDLPPLAYKTAEERLSQRKPCPGGQAERDVWPSNQFFMVEEVINEPDGGWPEELVQRNDLYLKLKGTLYEVYFYDEPDYDQVYFPGDELPEEYEVKVTEDYEVTITDTDALGDGHKDILPPSVYIVKKDLNSVSYEYYFDGMDLKEGLDPHTPYSEFDPYPFEPVICPGMYFEILYDDGRYSGGFEDYMLYQYLTREDLAKLPEGTDITSNYVAHY